MKMLFAIKCVVIIAISLTESITPQRCIPRPINVTQCQNKFYNYTSLPNMMGQDKEQDIQDRIDSFRPLLVNECSNELNFLLCSVYVPFCDFDTKIQLGPCRPMCEKVQTECEPLLKMFNLSWPENLNCSRFPTANTNGIQCMNRKIEDKPVLLTKVQSIPANTKTSYHSRQKPFHGQCQHLRNSDKYVFINRTGRCALKCTENDLFSTESKNVAEIWMTIIASMTFISTLFTCLTFVHSDRIRYPEQPIIFLTFSYNIYSLSMLLRIFLTRSKVSCDYDPVSGQKILIQEGLENTYCAITFLLNFFFSTATHMWWIMLGLCWTLFIGLNVSASSLAKNSGIFHLFVWLMTSVLTVSVLILRSVDADELFGVCSVGEQAPDLFLTFAIIPKIICLVIGLVFLGSGFVFFRMRTRQLNKNKETYYQQKATFIFSIGFRLGLFSVIYIVAISTLICCDMYQYYNYQHWLQAPRVYKDRQEPIVALFLLKIFMGQVVGINSAIWIWSLDASGSWRKLFGKLLDRANVLHKKASSPRQIAIISNRNSMSSNKYCQYYRSDH